MMVFNGETEILAKVESFDGSIMSPFKDIYEIYTNILKNSTYYDSTTGEEIECVVSVSEFDSKNDKKTLCVKLGSPKKGLNLFILIGVLTILAHIILVQKSILPLISLISLIPIIIYYILAYKKLKI